MTSPQVDTYVAARAALLDALDALEAHRGSLVLVGAQAVYAHTGDVPGTGVSTTTDADLALDADLLGDDPELAQALKGAGFMPGLNPGSWVTTSGIAVDLMVAPHQSGTTKRNPRAARLRAHDRASARVTAGLEAALVDHCPMRIVALDPDDERAVTIKVAGAAALLVAKCVKIEERARVVAAQPARLKTKDAVDVLRLLMAVETDVLVDGFAQHAGHGVAAAVSRQALRYLASERANDTQDVLAVLIRRQLDPVAVASYHALVDDLLAGVGAAGLAPVG